MATGDQFAESTSGDRFAYGPLGNPQIALIADLGLTLLEGIRRNRALPRNVPQPFTRFTTPGGGGGGFTGTQMTPQMESLLGPSNLPRFFGQGGSQPSLPGTNELNISDIVSGYYEDAFRRAGAQEAGNQRIRGQVGQYQTSLADALSRIGDVGRELREETLPYGEAAYDRARTGINQAEQRATTDTAQVVQNVGDTIQAFYRTANTLYSDAMQLRGEVLADAKNNTAALLVNASTSVQKQTQQQISDMAGEMRAMGMPEAQVQSQLGQVAASGQAQIGDLLGTIGAQENARLSSLQTETAKFVTGLAAPIVATTGQVLQAGMGEVGASVRNLSNIRTQLAEVRSNLENDAANWRGSVTQMRSNIESIYSQVALGGRMDIFNMISGIEDPVVELGPIMEGAMSLYIGLEELEYANNVGFYALEDAMYADFFNNARAAFSRAQDVAEARRNLSHGETEASLNRGASIASAALGGGGQALGGFFQNSSLFNPAPRRGSPSVVAG